MMDIDGKPFSTAVIGVVALATCYVAGWTDWVLLVLPLSVMVAFWLAIQSPAPTTGQPATTRGRAPVWATESHEVGIPTRFGAVSAAAGAGQAIELQMVRVFAEIERVMIRERVTVAFERGRAQVKALGRPTISTATDAAIRKALKKGDTGVQQGAARPATVDPLLWRQVLPNDRTPRLTGAARSRGRTHRAMAFRRTAPPGSSATTAPRGQDEMFVPALDDGFGLDARPWCRAPRPKAHYVICPPSDRHQSSPRSIGQRPLGIFSFCPLQTPSEASLRP